MTKSLIDVGGENAKLTRLRQAVGDLFGILKATPAKTLVFSLAVFDPKVLEADPSVAEAAETLRKRRGTLHRSKAFKFSADLLFGDKIRDIVGLYLSPPDRALALCIAEKCQVQVLDHTQPALPMLPSMPERWAHDYRRNGTTSLFVALDVVIGKCCRRHRAKGSSSPFSKEIDIQRGCLVNRFRYWWPLPAAEPRSARCCRRSPPPP